MRESTVQINSALLARFLISPGRRLSFHLHAVHVKRNSGRKQEPERDSIYGARERYALRVPRPIVVYEIGAILFDAIRNTT